MSDRTNAQLLQVLRRQLRQDRIVDLILSECRLVSFEAKTPQPTLDVHEDVALTQPVVCNHLPGETTCLGDRDERYGSKAVVSGSRRATVEPHRIAITSRTTTRRWPIEATHRHRPVIHRASKCIGGGTPIALPSCVT